MILIFIKPNFLFLKYYYSKNKHLIILIFKISPILYSIYLSHFIMILIMNIFMIMLYHIIYFFYVYHLNHISNQHFPLFFYEYQILFYKFFFMTFLIHFQLPSLNEKSNESFLHYLKTIIIQNMNLYLFIL